VYVRVSRYSSRILNAKITGEGSQKIRNFDTAEDNQTPIGGVKRLWTSNKQVKFHANIPSGSLEMTK